MRFLFIFVMLTVGLILAGCGGAPAPTTPPPQATTPAQPTMPPTAPPTPTVPPTAAGMVTATPEPPGATAAPTAVPPAVQTTAAQATAVPIAPVTEGSHLVGSYSAVLPAADAPGRIVTLDLALDGSATMTTQFIGKGEPSVESGTWTEQDGQAVVTFTVRDGQPEDNRVTWKLDGTQLVSTAYDQSAYGSAGLPLAQVGTGDIKEASFGGVSFSYDSSLAQSAEGAYLPARPVQNEPALGYGAPLGIFFKFNGETLPEYFDPLHPQIYVYPVEELKALDPSVAEGVTSLEKLLAEKPENPTDPIFVFPLIPANQGMRTNVEYLDFVNGSGVRFVTYYTHDISPVTNGRIFYTFQGITLDGQYYVSAYWPVTTPALPNADSAPDTSRYDAAQFEAYLNQVVSTLDSLPPAGYDPNLDLLDNMIQSINASPTFPTPTPGSAAPATTPESGTPTAAAQTAPTTAAAEATPAATQPPLPNETVAAPVAGMRDLYTAEQNGVKIAFSPALAQSAYGVTIPAQARDPNAPALGGGAPQHTAFGFNGEAITADITPFQPGVVVYRADALKDLDPKVAQEVLALQTMLEAKPTELTDPIPVLPIFNAQQMMHPQMKYLTMRGGKGVRFVTFYSQNVGPITNDGLFYTFQGLSDDGKYYVVVFWPLRTDKLPESYKDAGITDIDAWSKNFDSYLADTTAMLNGLAPGDFSPDLNLLDQLSQLIQVPQQ